MLDIWPRDTTSSMDRHQRAATVRTVTLSQREGGGAGFSRALHSGFLRETENLLRNYPIRIKAEKDQLCILGCNAKPSELTKNYPIRIEIDIYGSECLFSAPLSTCYFNLQVAFRMSFLKESLPTSSHPLTLSPFRHCRVTLKIMPELKFRLNETSNHFIQGEGGGRGRGRPPAVGMNQHTA